MKANKSILALFLLSMFFFLNSCEEERISNCDIPIQGETLTISEDAISYIANYENAERVVFITTSDEEVSYNISIVERNGGSYSHLDICPDDASAQQATEGVSEWLYVNLTNTIEPDKSFHIVLSELPIKTDQGDDSESLTIFTGEDLPFGLNGRLQFNLPLFETTTFSLPSDSLNIFGKEFLDVFDSGLITPSSSIEIKYTKAEGIVYFKDIFAGREYVYDRVE